MELVLGTAQFGLAYGIAGAAAPVAEREVRDILACARDAGITQLDTAQAYGDIESRLASLLPAGTHWRVTTKIAPPPSAARANEAAVVMLRSVEAARRHLGEHLDAVLLHDARTLALPHGEAVWSALVAACGSKLRHGISAYAPDELAALANQYDIAQAQLPGNAFDQRIAANPQLDRDIGLFVRSAFLQGLLLMPIEAAQRKLPAAGPALARWHTWCAQRDLAPLSGALSIVRGLPGVSGCVIGVDSAAQLAQIVDAWECAHPLQAPELAVDDPEVIDPRRWSAPA